MYLLKFIQNKKKILKDCSISMEKSENIILSKQKVFYLKNYSTKVLPNLLRFCSLQIDRYFRLCVSMYIFIIRSASSAVNNSRRLYHKNHRFLFLISEFWCL